MAMTKKTMNKYVPDKVSPDEVVLVTNKGQHRSVHLKKFIENATYQGDGKEFSGTWMYLFQDGQFSTLHHEHFKRLDTQYWKYWGPHTKQMEKSPYIVFGEEREKGMELDKIGSKAVETIKREELDVYIGTSADELLRKFNDSYNEIHSLNSTITDLEVALEDIEEPEVIEDLATYNQQRREMQALRELHGETIESSGKVLEKTRRRCNVLIKAMQENDDIPKRKWIRCGSQGIQISEEGYMMRPWSEIEVLKNLYVLGDARTSDYVIGGLALTAIASLLGMCMMFSWAFLIPIIPAVMLIFSIGSTYQTRKAIEYENAKAVESHFNPIV